MRFKLSLLIIPLVLLSSTLRADIHVAAGESIQKAIDSASDGATIKIDAGLFEEPLNITRSVILQGAGWDQTILKPKKENPIRTDAEKIDFADRLLAASSPREQGFIINEFLHASTIPAIRVSNAKSISLQGIGVRCQPLAKPDGLTAETLVDLNDAQVQMTDCSIVGPCMNGITVRNGSNLELQHSLVAAAWNTGVAIYSGSNQNDKPAKAHLIDCDLRNCYLRCITVSGEGTIIDKCRISGSAWHGIRYDNCSPTIIDNFIFANARCGIYASGATSATVRGNVFWKNEMDAMSCWFNNTDTIEGNTIVGNLREGIAVCGDAKPTLTQNIFAGNPIGISCTQVNEKGQLAGNPQPAMRGNLFWENSVDVSRLGQTEAAPADSTQADPKFIDQNKQNFSLADNSPARQAKIGAALPIAFQSPWPTQLEEVSIIPDSDTRDFSKWKNAVAGK